MNNMECVVSCLSTHREARGWTDQAVATDLLAQLGLDPDGEAKNAVAPHDPTLVTEAEVVAAETAAQEAADKAKEARDKLNAQTATDAQAKADAATDQANAAKATREAAAKEQPAAAEDHANRPAQTQRGQPAAGQHQPGRRG